MREGLKDSLSRRRVRKRLLQRRWQRVVSVLGCIVVFCVTYALILPAITLTNKTPICGMEEHAHTDDCYEQVLACGLEESEGHAHTDACYDEEGNLTCGLEESAGHVHDESCYEQRLTCELEEHAHTDACYPAEEDEPELEDETAAAAAIKLEQKTDTVRVTVEAPEGALPEGATLKLKDVKSEDYLNAVREATRLEELTAENVMAVDITFLDETGAKVEPTENVKVSLTKRGEETGIAKTADVVHIKDDGKGELVKSEVVKTDDEKGVEEGLKDDKVAFESDKFSVYVVVEGEGAGQGARATVNFYGADTTTPVATVYVKNSDDDAQLEKTVYDPGAGDLAPGQIFRGWYIGETDDYTGETVAKNIEGVRAYLRDLEISEGTTVNVYAMIFSAYNVQFKDESGVTIHSETLINRTGEGAPYTVNMPYTPKSQDSDFKGWNVNTGSDLIEPAPGDMEDGLYPNGTAVTVSGDIIFTPQAPEGHWLSFEENGSGASYTPPQFVLTGETPVEPSENPTRNGYSFGGWYKDAACTNGSEFNFSQQLSQNTTAYAKWVPNARAPYTVIVWRQSVTDNHDVADANKTYDFAFSTTETAASHANVAGLNLSRYTGLDGESIAIDGVAQSFYGFKYNTTRGVVSEDTVVEPNGTTVVNLYYDREVVTYDFVIPYRETSSTESGYYYIPNANGGYDRVYLYRYNNRWYRDYSWWWPYYTNEYTGTVYERNWASRETFTGLYGQRLSKYGYTWPTDYRWFISSSENETSFVSIIDMFEESANRNPSNEFHTDFYGRESNFNTEVRHYLQNEDDSWPTAATYKVPTIVGNGMTFRSFQGFTPSEFRIKLPQGVNRYSTGTSYSGNNLVKPVAHSAVNGWTDWLPVGTGVEYDGKYWHQIGVYDATVGGLEFRYSRNDYPLTFMAGQFVNSQGEVQDSPITGTLKTVTGINYESSLASYAEGGADYYEPDEQAGYSFAGWYIDATCTTPVDFENTTMPLDGTTVYGKWVKTQYRVLMHPNVDPSDTSLNWGNQEMSFRIDYGEKIAGGNNVNGTRLDYELIGWYTDEACTQAFNFGAYVLNDTTVTAEYDQTEPTELNKYGLPTSTVNSDAANNRTWITRKLDLYAKWRAKLVGAHGINVVYQANGKGVNDQGQVVDVEGTSAPTDVLEYLDNSEAVSQDASRPVDGENYQFLYWVVQTWDEDAGEYADTTTHVYPGDTFTVLKANARVEDATDPSDPSVTHKYTVQLRAQYGPKSEPTPTHITWYDNFTPNPVENTNYKTDDDLQINEAVDIEDPWFTRTGYTFLGWARVDTTDAEGNPLPGYTLSPRDLGKNDIFLKYEDGVFKAEVNGQWTAVTQVAADEVYPYHDLYAVWEKTPVVKIIKVDKDNNDKPLPGAVFSMAQGQTTLYEGLTSGTDGYLATGGASSTTQFTLPVGSYTLSETTPPTGYNPATGGVTITVNDSAVATDQRVTYAQADDNQGVSNVATYDATTETYTVTITNSAGATLPSAGGPGTTSFTLLGAMLVVFSVAMAGLTNKARLADALRARRRGGDAKR